MRNIIKIFVAINTILFWTILFFSNDVFSLKNQTELSKNLYEAASFTLSNDRNLDGIEDTHHHATKTFIPETISAPNSIGEIVHSIPYPGTEGPNGLTWDGQNLWVSNIYNQTIYKINPQNGSVLSSFPAPASSVEGLAWDGQRLWAAGYNDGEKIYQLNPENGNVIRSFTAPGPWSHGITYDGENLWVNDFIDQRLYKVNPSNGATISSIPAPAEGSIGLTWDGESLWSDSFHTGLLYRIEPTSGAILQTIDIPHGNPRDLAWDGQFIWVASLGYFSPLPSRIDKLSVNFVPNPDGYHFTNYRGVNFSDYTINDMRRMFGDDAVCRMVRGVCFPRPTAVFWNTNANWIMRGGHCEGMSVTSLRFFQDFDDPSSFQSGADFTHDLNLNNSRRNIAYYFVEQLTDPVRSTRNSSLRNSTPVDILNQLQAERFGTDTFNLAIFNYSISSGHAVSPYRLNQVSHDTWRIFVYDNNHPNDLNRFVSINTSANTWSYDLGGGLGVWSGSAAQHSIGLVPLSVYSASPVCPWCDNSTSVNESQIVSNNSIWLNGEGHLLISNSSGLRIGFDGNNFINEIPAADSSIPVGGLGVFQEPIYIIPPDEYSILLDGQTVVETNTVSVSQIGPGYALSIEGVSLDSSTQDVITLASDGTQLTYRATNTQETTLKMALEQPTESLEFRLIGADIGNGQIVTSTIDVLGGNFVVINRDNNGGRYDFFFGRTNDFGLDMFLHSDLVILQSDTHYINYGNWSEGDSMTLQIDHNSDGSIDESFELENELPMIYLPIVMQN